MKHILFIISVLVMSLNSQAKVEALFHPYDNTMEKIADIFMNAESTIDMALYNIDSKKKNPVIAALLSDEIQKKIHSGDLTVRILFEGYMSKEENFDKMKKLEAIGIDARYVGATQKMHHKFATVDAGTAKPILITGSANWSMMSQRFYNESVLFMENQPGITNNFQREFELLWSQSKEFGDEYVYVHNFLDGITSVDFILEPGIGVKFNTDNFEVKGNKKSRFKKRKDVNYVLTRELVAAIDSAKEKIEIATTRLVLRPIYDAVMRAAARGVKINLVITMGQFEPKFIRKKNVMRNEVKKGKKMVSCDEDPYLRRCSTSQKFAGFLNDLDYEGSENVKVRIKYFDLRHDAYLQKQMHSKYMIIDDKNVLTGSFNWSYSAEYNHFENLVTLDGALHEAAVENFNNDFNYLWNLGRQNLWGMQRALKKNKQFKCSFSPMTLTYDEVDGLLNGAKKVARSMKRAVKKAAEKEAQEAEEFASTGAGYTPRKSKVVKGKLIDDIFCGGKIKIDLSE